MLSRFIYTVACLGTSFLLWLNTALLWDFPGGSMVKNPPAMQEMRVESLGQEDALQEERATHSSILACRIPWTQGASRLQSMGVTKESGTA